MTDTRPILHCPSCKCDVVTTPAGRCPWCETLIHTPEKPPPVANTCRCGAPALHHRTRCSSCQRQDSKTGAYHRPGRPRACEHARTRADVVAA